MGQRGRHVGRAFERRPSGQHLEQHHPERIKVGTGVRFATLDLLRCQVLRGPQHGPTGSKVPTRRRRRFGYAEVRHLDPHHAAALVAQQHVGRLDIPVNETLGVRIGQSVSDLGNQGHGKVSREGAGPGDQIPERLSGHQFHHDERSA